MRHNSVTAMKNESLRPPSSAGNLAGEEPVDRFNRLAFHSSPTTIASASSAAFAFAERGTGRIGSLLAAGLVALGAVVADSIEVIDEYAASLARPSWEATCSNAPTGAIKLPTSRKTQ